AKAARPRARTKRTKSTAVDESEISGTVARIPGADARDVAREGTIARRRCPTRNLPATRVAANDRPRARTRPSP
ncbi:MAG: hypothetical protein MHM6MM_009503, partial [Cercozoa sp. M6MM]